MIPRYSRPEMVEIWEPATRFRIWFEIEAHAATACADLGIIPQEAAKVIWEKGSAATFDVDLRVSRRIPERERGAPRGIRSPSTGTYFGCIFRRQGAPSSPSRLRILRITPTSKAAHG